MTMPRATKKDVASADQAQSFIASLNRKYSPKSVQADDAIIPFKNPAAVALGRLGGLMGGKARAKALTAAQRSEIARKGGQNSWKNRRD